MSAMLPELRVRVDDTERFATSVAFASHGRVIISIITAAGNELHLDVYPDGRVEGLCGGQAVKLHINERGKTP